MQTLNTVLTPGMLRKVLREKGSASLAELAAQFSVSAQTVSGILAYWQHRGNIEVQGVEVDNSALEAPACGGCKGCLAACADAPSLPVFRWKELS